MRPDAGARILLTLLFATAVVSTPSTKLAAFAAWGGFLSWICAYAGVSTRAVFTKAALVLPFSCVAALWLPFARGGESMEVLGGFFSLSLPGIWLLAGVALKSFICAAALVLLTRTTPLERLLDGLYALRCPAIIVEMLAMTHRFIYLLGDEARALMTAARSRGWRGRWLKDAHLIGRLTGALFLRSLDRAERVSDAMRLRGFDGAIRGRDRRSLGVGDWCAVLGAVPLLAAVRLWL